MPEQILVEQEGTITVFRLHGQFIGGDETDTLREEFKKLAQHENPIVIVDLEHVTYLNSTALGVFISAHANLSKRGGRIILCNVSKNIEHIFVITKLTLVFEIFTTREEAIKHLSFNS
ncbi:MAG: STAS domain-containing protein [Bacteroidota bacterium]|nr:STAS domain-containing protein [Candidatus Kapabacteria bacterium]MDW8220669.1 STAS domain-containing protein [Bacteroidota bacterium]